MVTAEELQQICRSHCRAKRNHYMPCLQQAMIEFEINTYLREAAFWRNWRTTERVALDGGDSRRQSLRRKATISAIPNRAMADATKGAALSTDRAGKLREFGKRLGLLWHLIGTPQMACQPEVGFRVAGLYWKLRGLNALADEENFMKITRRINGDHGAKTG